MNDQDKKQLEAHGISEQTFNEQLARFAEGFPWLRVRQAATVGAGIMRLTPQQEQQALRSWLAFRQTGASIEKFQPASGAATRMFKNLFAMLNDAEKTTPETDFEKSFFEGIKRFAFYGILNRKCVELYKSSVSELMEQGRYRDVLTALLLPEGLNYGSLPKALLLFHNAATGAHTPLEEHLEEGAQYAADANRRVRLHFTVSPEHRAQFERLIAAKVPQMEKVWGVKYDISLSEQSPATDTVAVTLDGKPYRDAEGKLVFRPAGHGALLQNLNAREAAVVFIKNVDNVVPLRLRGTGTHYKKVLAGYLVNTQARIADLLRRLDKDLSDEKLRARAKAFVEKELCVTIDGFNDLSVSEQVALLRAKLDRPIRVCGVVRNEGEPGGGPYLAYSADGSCAPQILESAQINPDDAQAVAMMQAGTHFNPVDLVCFLHNYKGEKFDLSRYVDAQTGFISQKSVAGTEIKALELPGLWNGSMSDWNTIFVEVPAETFNPVKTVNDLLRPQHQ